MSPAPFLESAVTADSEWQMHLGERHAFEGLLATLKPQLAIEIGRAEGGSLRRIAAHAGHVHSFDLVPPPDALVADLENVTFHTGDSSVQVPETLARLAAEGGHVDFALVDGDHSAEGVRRDAEALLASPACRTTTIVFHDAANEIVREGLEKVRFRERPNVALELLDFVPGYVVESGAYAMQIWNGLGLVVLDDGRAGPPIVEQFRYDAAELNRRVRDQIAAGPPGPPEPEDGTSRAGAAVAVGGALAAGALAGWLGARARRG
jgi:hypothetical protein